MDKKEYGCDDIIALLDEYLDGETDASVTEAVEAHISACAECRAALEEKRELRRLVSLLDETPPDDMHARVMEKVRLDSAAKAKKRMSIRRWTAAAAVVLTFGVTLTAGIIASTISGTKSDMAPGGGEDRFPVYAEKPSGDEAGDYPENYPGGMPPKDEAAGEITSPVADVADEKLLESFASYDAGYDGGYVIFIDGADADAGAKLAELVGAAFDGKAFVLPYSQDTCDTLLSKADALGDVTSGVCGRAEGKMCIIVVLSADGG